MRRCRNNLALRLRANRLAASAMLGLIGASTAHAQIVPDTTISGRPTISEARNGVPVIAINPPSSAGVSFNVYQAFGVGESGVVLNNSTRPVGTELAYNVSRNPNLGEQAARVIVSEVNGSQPSVLSGKIEVAGRRADVVIANPNGIVCSGCGFIWTDRVVLTTGHRVDSGNIELDAFNVIRGEINIERLIAPDLAQLDLIGRKVRINGELRAMDVRVISGGNRIRYLSKQERADGADEVETRFIGKGKRHPNGIDVATLGGIHANKIRLLSTENGIGVRVAGKLASSAGDLEIVSAGSLNMEGSLSSSGALVIRAGSSAKVGPPPASVAANGSGDAGGSQPAGGGGTGGLHVHGEGVGTGGSQVAGGGVGAGGSPVDGGSAGPGESNADGGGVEAGGSPAVGGGVEAGGSSAVGEGVEAGGAPADSGGVEAGGSPAVGEGVEGAPADSGGVKAGGSPADGGGVEAGGSPAIGGGVGTDESQVSAGTRQSSANASLFTLTGTAPGTTIARVDESFRQQRIASEQLLPERHRRSYDASDFEHGHGVISHGVFSSSVAGHVNHLTAGSPS